MNKETIKNNQHKIKKRGREKERGSEGASAKLQFP